MMDIYYIKIFLNDFRIKFKIIKINRNKKIKRNKYVGKII